MLHRRHLPAFALALAAALAPARPARANVAAPVTDPGRLTGPRFMTKTPLVVREERLSFQCEETERKPVCYFEARYQIENPEAEASGGRAAFYGLHADNIAVKVNGQPASALLSPADIAALDAEVIGAEEGSSGAMMWKERGAGLVRHGFNLSVPPGGRSEIVVTGRMMPGQTIYSRGYGYTPAEARHLLLHIGNDEPRIFEFDYLVSPIKSWARVHRMEVSIRHPKSWAMNGSIYGTPDRSRTQWQERTEGDFKVMSASTLGEDEPKAIGNVLDLRVILPGDAIEHGGPFLGFGAVVGSSAASGFRARFGYEMAAPWWLVESITFDTDFQERLVLSPNVEAATGQITMLPILPSLSAGIGVPIQILPKATVGARLMATVQLWAVGFVTAVDIYPALSPEEGKLQVSLMGRASL